MAKSSTLKTSVAKARKAIKGATKIAGLPKLPSDLEYYRQSDGKIGIREKAPDGPGGWMRGSGLKIKA